MNSPTDLIARPDALMLDLRAASGEAAVRALHTRLGDGAGAVTAPAEFLTDLLARMQVASVCIADDIALPHARTAAVSRLVFAVGRAVEDIGFDATHPRVRLVFLIGTPKAAVAEYLQIVAGLSRLLKNAATRAALLAAPTETEFRAQLARGASR